MSNYSKLSDYLTKSISNLEKKKNGIYFTPYEMIKLCLNYLPLNITDVLEPSCGSCQFIDLLDKHYSNINIRGIELNELIYDNIKNYKSINNNITIINLNYLEYKSDELYDLIIGNPPYFITKDKKYNEYYEGRPNIFIQFIIHSLKLLKEGGILSFILPKSFLNCIYYNKLRIYISNNYRIIEIINCSDLKFYDTFQETILIIIKKEKGNNNRYILKIKDIISYNTSDNIKRLNELLCDSVSLIDLEYDVKVGNILWNECKGLLTSDNSKTRLIYSSDIKDGELIFKDKKNKEKKDYIDRDGSNEIILVLNRGYGRGSYKLNYSIIDIKENYLIENHLIIIRYKGDKIEREELLKRYNEIKRSLGDNRTEEFIKIYMGNNAINTKELLYIIPIYLKCIND